LPFSTAPKRAIIAPDRSSDAQGDGLMRSRCSALALVLTLLSLSTVRAQILVDVSKVTCDQFVHGKVGEPRQMAVWLSGFYYGQKNITVVDQQSFENNFSKLQTFCYDNKNFDMLIMQAIERIMAPGR
jgi:acid stress chaperone HdeB